MNTFTLSPFGRNEGSQGKEKKGIDMTWLSTDTMYKEQKLGIDQSGKK